MVRQFPEWSEITLEDEAVFAERAERVQPATSELTFANLFVWRRCYDFRATSLGGAFCILASPCEESPFVLPPVGSADAPAVTFELLDYMKNQGMKPQMRRAPQQLANALAEENASLDIHLDRDHSDYVYLASDLASLAGRRYSKKRNQIAQFRGRYEYEYRRISPALLPQCRDLQGAWCDTRDCFIPENSSLAEENVAVLEAIDNFETLDLIGGAILVEDKVEAFTIGGRLNNDTLVIHFEKGNPAMPGIYQVVNQAFCADAANGYTYVNREQDLGDAGLRQAKKSYYPHHLVDKYVVRMQ